LTGFWALSAARRAGASDNQQHSVLLNTMAELSEFPVDSTPPQLAYWIHQQVQQMTNNILKSLTGFCAVFSIF
jgi:chemotaxis protein CheY-P-specific phosphatase CheC